MKLIAIGPPGYPSAAWRGGEHEEMYYTIDAWKHQPRSKPRYLGRGHTVNIPGVRCTGSSISSTA
jgi:hypothetical protein